MDQPDRRRSNDRFPAERIVGVVVIGVLTAALGWAGSLLSEVSRSMPGYATKEALAAQTLATERAIGVVNNELTVLKVGHAFEMRAIDSRTSTLERQVESLRARGSGPYSSPN